MTINLLAVLQPNANLRSLKSDTVEWPASAPAHWPGVRCPDPIRRAVAGALVPANPGAHVDRPAPACAWAGRWRGLGGPDFARA
jgi:hypothetical protein